MDPQEVIITGINIPYMNLLIFTAKLAGAIFPVALAFTILLNLGPYLMFLWQSGG